MSRRWNRRTVLGLAFLAVGVVILLGGAWVVVTGLLARSQLESARSEIDTLRGQLTAGDVAAARRTAVEVASHARRAHELTTGPAWATVAAIPAGGEPFGTTREITDQVDRLGTQVLPGLIAASTRLDPSRLRGPDGQIRVAAIASIAPELGRADTAVSRAVSAMRAQPSSTWLSSVDAARRSFLAQLTGLRRTVRSADLAATIAPTMLGQHGTQRYFVAFENDAEARGIGGIPGAFAVVAVTDGRLHFEKFESDGYLGTTPTGLQFGAAYDNLLAGARSTSFYVNSDITPQFSYAARIWMAMWQRRTGQHLDGALALDPTAVSYLLGVTGPATVAGGGQVTAANVVALTQSTVYARYPKLSQVAARKKYLLLVAQAVSKRLLVPGVDAVGLLKAAGMAASQRRLLVYSADPAIERHLAATSLGGEVPVTSRPYVGLVVVNVAGNKLDYYLHRQVTWDRQGCGAQRQVTVTARLTNSAPAHGLSPYVTAREDFPSFRTKSGDNRLAVDYYATDGARLTSLTIDGRTAPASFGTLAGHPVFIADVELPRGTTQTVVFTMTEPAGSGSPIVLNQPLVNPSGITIEQSTCR